MLKIYQNEFSNDLTFNIHKLKLCESDRLNTSTYIGKDFELSLLNSKNYELLNEGHIIKVMLYLLNQITSSGLNSIKLNIPNEEFKQCLNISKMSSIYLSINYLNDIRYYTKKGTKILK